jgi:hypothetical protein
MSKRDWLWEMKEYMKFMHCIGQHRSSHQENETKSKTTRKAKPGEFAVKFLRSLAVIV